MSSNIHVNKVVSRKQSSVVTTKLSTITTYRLTDGSMDQVTTTTTNTTNNQKVVVHPEPHADKYKLHIDRVHDQGIKISAVHLHTRMVYEVLVTTQKLIGLGLGMYSLGATVRMLQRAADGSQSYQLVLRKNNNKLSMNVRSRNSMPIIDLDFVLKRKGLSSFSNSFLHICKFDKPIFFACLYSGATWTACCLFGDDGQACAYGARRARNH